MRTILVIFIGISFFLIFLFNLNQTADAHNQAGCNAENEGDTCYYQGENYCCGSDYCNTQFEGECTQYDDGEGTIHSHCNFVTELASFVDHARETVPPPTGSVVGVAVNASHFGRVSTGVSFTVMVAVQVSFLSPVPNAVSV